jgi:hypothetical protein
MCLLKIKLNYIDNCLLFLLTEDYLVKYAYGIQYVPNASFEKILPYSTNTPLWHI